MLAPSEVGSFAHVLQWLDKEDPDRAYEWQSPIECPCGQYVAAHGNKPWSEYPAIGGGPYPISAPENGSLHALAAVKPHTFGALYLRAAKAWMPSHAF